MICRLCGFLEAFRIPLFGTRSLRTDYVLCPHCGEISDEVDR
jgi:hypothetical protein